MAISWQTAVIVSHPKRVSNKPTLEVVLCSTQQAGRAPDSNEVLLDSADGLNWETLCKCDLLWSMEKSALHTFRGTVSGERRKQIIRTIVRSHG
jgi:hypothetical protein